ncbi:sporulation membrane protein YtaF [Halanaerobacter jeridensis]|uniref:Sporulation protein YtaF n=1 Tax=Halanaerobacter jeridensis TaxID=706427 RepID=A0A938XXG2_9FIRM|nr:putative sporulation protein YtaF [Halanaerobacter jeridensis]
MNLLPVLILALAISLDGFLAGITYGLKGIKINLCPIVIISIASGVMVLFSMVCGSWLTKLFPALWASKIGGLLLVLIGGWLLYQSAREIDNNEDIAKKWPRELFSFEINSLGLIINILQEPLRADLDYSGTISKQEAVVLGTALALDAFGAGIGAAMAGYNILATAIFVIAFKFVLLKMGVWLGTNTTADYSRNNLKLTPGFILIILGLIKLL